MSLPDGEFRVIFEAFVGESDHGDIAVDDVVVYNRPCEELGLETEEEVSSEEQSGEGIVLVAPRFDEEWPVLLLLYSNFH